ncbi:hypothetical protein BDB01DRAFT_900518 [Pilobolus umbonatus]|nr:hypothetical protein BDB01DRAFT_900518 [Pilobolus umbonatus]
MPSNIKLLFLLVIGYASCYCIYNQLFDGSSFLIEQKGENVPEKRYFKQSIGPFQTECCHFTNPDCSRNSVNDEIVFFKIWFSWSGHESDVHISQCTSGGALIIYGDANDYRAVCSNAQGEMRLMPMFRFNPLSS